MILIDKPYVSDFLIETIKKNNFQIVDTESAKSLINDESLNWISEKEAVQQLKENSKTKLYTNSENTISWVEKKLGFTSIPKKINLFKNKIKFRELLKDIFPNYFFKGVKFENLDSISTKDLHFPLIIKPAVGFFSLGVHKIDEPHEWNEIVTKLKAEFTQIQSLFPKEVVDTTYFIIEECIEGAEYAIDCYYNNEGEPVILNSMLHVFSSGKDVSDRVYTSSKNSIETTIKNVEKLLKIIGKKANLINFPMHIEVRITTEGIVIPIEVNPLRFGGLCTTGDLSWFAYGFNSYEYFLNNKKPNWEEILKSKKDKLYSIVLLNNNSGYLPSEIESFNYELVLKDFENPLSLRKFDFNEYPIFGILFTETSVGNEDELSKILTSNLIKYLTIK
ncbi:ATP-grasp domain-containing protein [Lutibacter sp.]|uniref:ATP-grasp domain-containing protein n=1 Tax=Lutibacter sp. TaxID=1925666 RepID=UPI002736C5A5|nr:ATP-grasp domain-containing protein [Lutibacter sp.]MDP3313963.1 ATP-grasp domain-containing protein [Lutibacter sp.]